MSSRDGSEEILAEGEEDLVVTATRDEDGVDFLDQDQASNSKGSGIMDFKLKLRGYAYTPTTSSNGKPATRTTRADPKILVSKRPTQSPPRKGTISPARGRASSTASPSKRRRINQDSNSPAPSPSRSVSRSVARAAKRSTDPYHPTNNFVDSIRPNLHLLMIGLNPGLTTASTGHAYAHPSNLFWKLLHSSGLTDYRHPPSDTRALMDLYSIGNTNLCERPTRDGSGLSKAEMEEGVGIIDEKVRRYKPEVVCIVGKGIWDTIERVKRRELAERQSSSSSSATSDPTISSFFSKSSSSSTVTSSPTKKAKKPSTTTTPRQPFSYGWQDEPFWLGREVDPVDGTTVLWPGARTFVATTTSGLAAGMRPHEKEEVWKRLGDVIVRERRERRDFIKDEDEDVVEVKDEP